MRLRSRTGTALTLACLLAGSAWAQAPDDNNAPPPSLHISPVEVEAPDLEEPLPDWNFDDADIADAFDPDDTESWHPQTDFDALDAAYEAYLKLPDLQLERPEWEAPPPEPLKPPPRWLTWLSDLLGGLAPLFQYLFYAIIVLVLGGLLYFIFGEAIRVRFGRSGAGKVSDDDDILVDVRPDAAMARGLLDEADALARAGKFAEAVHLLLFRSIEDIQTRLEGGVPKSLTAREIGGLGRLPERARRGLGPIIAIVERSFFGGRDVDATGWQEARASYEDFAFGEGWA